MLEDAGAYGRVVRDRAGAVTAIVEARDASPAEIAIREINTGVYLARAAVLRASLAELRPNNAQGEYYLTDLVTIARRNGLAVQAWCAPEAAEFAGINSLKELAEMEAEIRAAVNRRLMEAGVTIVDPATAYIGEQVEIGRDSVVGPNVQILGRSKVGEGVRIEGTAYLRDVEIGDGCHLKLGVRAEECRIGPDCEIGPFANLRAGTELEGHNRIGNFVETKKARLGKGTKASHLSYLGDTVIGRETNIGCGVITVNYDGYEKHLTRIGEPLHDRMRHPVGRAGQGRRRRLRRIGHHNFARSARRRAVRVASSAEGQARMDRRMAPPAWRSPRGGRIGVTPQPP